MGKPRKRQSVITRSRILFAGGFAGILYETIVEKIDRPALLAVFAGMLGLPLFTGRDQKHDDDNEPDKHERGG